jgi:uncharacterized DUF497 family protein
MKISYDPAKREATLLERGLDFEDAWQLFEPPTVTFEDDRFDYPEQRQITVGYLNNRMAMVAWTLTEQGIRVISMRKINEREQKRFAPRMG